MRISDWSSDVCSSDLSERAALAAERAKLAEMKPYRKTNSPSTRQAVRRTLRTALNSAIAHQLITFNPASHVELEPGKRRSEERRVGKECVSTCRYRWSPYH